MSISSPLSVEQAEAVARNVQAVEGVADLNAGRFGEVAMLFPHTRVHGLRSKADGGVEVHVTIDLNHLGKDTDLRAFAEQIRDVVKSTVDLPADVVLADATY